MQVADLAPLVGYLLSYLVQHRLPLLALRQQLGVFFLLAGFDGGQCVGLLAGVGSQRLLALQRYQILDSPRERSFDDLVTIATALCGTRMGAVTLVDQDRQWFKARQLLEAAETSRDISFCGHAILQDDIMVVRDVNQDERFIDNPLVTGEPHIQFYAGAPLKLPGGQNVGTLCLLDSKPRTLDAIDLAILGSLRDLAVEELVRREHGDAAP